MDDRVQTLVAEYYAGRLSRRQFLIRASVLVGGLSAALGLLAGTSTALATDPTPTPDEPMLTPMPTARIVTEMVEFEANGTTAPGYLARPEEEGPFPGVVVIQEWWGLDEHIKSVTERMAEEGFAAIAPDLYRGEVAIEPNDARRLVMELEMDQALKDIQGAVNYLIEQPFVGPKQAGVMGFCFGGQIAMRMSYAGENVGAVVVFYGGGIQPTDEELRAVSAPMLGLYGEADAGIPVALIQEWERKLKEFDKINEMVIYDDAPHAFFNDTRPSYRPEAAADAWQRTLEWFREYLVDTSPG